MPNLRVMSSFRKGKKFWLLAWTLSFWKAFSTENNKTCETNILIVIQSTWETISAFDIKKSQNTRKNMQWTHSGSIFFHKIKNVVDLCFSQINWAELFFSSVSVAYINIFRNFGQVSSFFIEKEHLLDVKILSGFVVPTQHLSKEDNRNFLELNPQTQKFVGLKYRCRKQAGSFRDIWVSIWKLIENKTTFWFLALTGLWFTEQKKALLTESDSLRVNLMIETLNKEIKHKSTEKREIDFWDESLIPSSVPTKRILMEFFYTLMFQSETLLKLKNFRLRQNWKKPSQ